MDADPASQPGFQTGEVSRFEILGTTVRRVPARQVDLLKVIVLDRPSGKDRFHAIFDVLDDAAGVGVLDLRSLGRGTPTRASAASQPMTQRIMRVQKPRRSRLS